MRSAVSLVILGLVAGCGQITLAPDDMGVVVDDMAAFRGDLAGSDGPAGPITPAIRVATDYVGFPTKLDATASTDAKSRTLSYLWHFTSVPAGSNVGDSCAPANGFATCLSDPTVAMPTFEPDVGGSYGITLTVKAGMDVARRCPRASTIPTDAVFVSYGHTSNVTDTAIFGAAHRRHRPQRRRPGRRHGDGGLLTNDNSTGRSWSSPGSTPACVRSQCLPRRHRRAQQLLLPQPRLLRRRHQRLLVRRQRHQRLHRQSGGAHRRSERPAHLPARVPALLARR